jgi:hypothetical protein
MRLGRSNACHHQAVRGADQVEIGCSESSLLGMDEAIPPTPAHRDSAGQVARDTL